MGTDAQVVQSDASVHGTQHLARPAQITAASSKSGSLGAVRLDDATKAEAARDESSSAVMALGPVLSSQGSACMLAQCRLPL